MSRLSSPSRRRPHDGWVTAIAMVVLAAIVLPVIFVFGSYRYVSTAADYADSTPTDAIVVLGAAQYDGRPSPVLRARLQHAKELYSVGVAPRIITVGGRQSGDRFTEAEVGRNWLIDQGVDADDIVAVEQGHDTLDSLTAVAHRVSSEGVTSITVATDPAHIARSMAIAHRLGFDVHGYPTQTGDGSHAADDYLLRETSAYLAFEAWQQWSVPRVIQG